MDTNEKYGSGAVQKIKVIPNQFDSSFPVPDQYDSKYFKYLGNIKQLDTSVIDYFRTKDISHIETAIKKLSNSIQNHIFLIGMGCVIIDHEQLYIDAGYKSYFDYAKHLYEETGLSEASISTSKTIVEKYIQYNAELRKHDFRFDGNSNKLLHLENAIDLHKKNPNDVFKHIVNDTYREFKEYSRTPEGRRALPPPIPNAKIKNGKIIVDGKNFEDLPEKIQKTIEQDFSNLYSIRASGNAPVIVEAYDEREARTLRNRIDKLIKELRVKR